MFAGLFTANIARRPWPLGVSVAAQVASDRAAAGPPAENLRQR